MMDSRFGHDVFGAVVLLVVERTCSSRVMSGEYCVRFSSLKKLISSSSSSSSSSVVHPSRRPRSRNHPTDSPLGRFMNRKSNRRVRKRNEVPPCSLPRVFSFADSPTDY